MNIVLIGFRCVGKSTVGKHLALRLRRPFIDTDHLIEKRQRLSIKEMVDTLGWDHFRRIEKAIVEEVSCLDHRVIAAGGGVPVDPENTKALKKRGLIVWLKADRQVLHRRLAQDVRTPVQRPPLTGKGVLEELDQVMACRAPFYEKAMDAQLDTSTLDVDSAVACLMAMLNQRRV